MADSPSLPPTPPPTAASPPPYAPPPAPRRLTRSTRERMWAGVAGGMADYFDLDPSLVRLLWIAATVVTGGLAVAVYIIAWIILPRDDRVAGGRGSAWQHWSEEFHSETARLASEMGRVADDVRGRGAPGQDTPTSLTSDLPASPADDSWWRSEQYLDRPRMHHRPSRSAGVALVVLGVLLLAANAGVFSWIQWRMMWPLIFIGLGVILLGRQSGWWGR